MNITKIMVLAYSVFFLQNCFTTAPVKETTLGEKLNERISNPSDTTQTLKVYFETNRKILSPNPSCSNEHYGVQIDGTERYGACAVSVPAEHEIGNLFLEPSKGKEVSFILESHSNMDKDVFFNSIKAETFPEVLVFVHGFNVKFEEAVLRAAQIKYDLKFAGPVVLFTWPAGSEDGFLSKIRIDDTYKNNFANAMGSGEHFKEFLSRISNLGKVAHVIVHSMGHQVVLRGIDKVYSQKKERFIKELVLNAPDFESVEFANIAPNLKASAERITVYCSPGDNALVASSKVNSNKRVGSCEKIPGVDMINVNQVDAPVFGLGHGYYSSRPVLTDLFQTILGIEARRRLFIRKSGPYNSEDYVLRK
ncbi:MAG TPA: alpha/beta hydrolase [Leptospiraceae bacterium]|nr:alpha/beta hydrolase [Leptospiraceae bacterium]HNF24308.1 alpha/beta hydrolase [Leptospiraceae bacterium]HNH10229.1 alpha/beta hydrolase [Leptospiraceae bacterium]HNI26209.1 alpha/beta hydrolase [Leptospiraceae bacterium]HNI97376.1 alpha/beta hydrolase [Leptospiraceae bacterium]